MKDHFNKDSRDNDFLKKNNQLMCGYNHSFAQANLL